MGEARRKRLLREVELRMVKQIDSAVDLARVSSAIRKLAEAASSHVGADCYLHADLCRELLKQHGVESRLVIGFAAWRVGGGHGDVIVHAPLQGMAPQPEALPFHAWLEIGPAESDHRLILDFSTYQLRRKAAELDALDGGHTNVNWCPDYLAALATDVSSLEDVTMETKGLFFYRPHNDLQRYVEQKAGTIDQVDLNNLILLYRNPNIQVIGPNDINDL